MDPTSRRRSSFIPSWAIDDEDDECLTTTARTGRRRKFSWGAVGERGLRDSIKSARSASSRSPVSHHECNSFQSFSVRFNLLQLYIAFDVWIHNINYFCI